MLPWQLREKEDPAVRTTSVWFGRKLEFRRIHVGPGSPETRKQKIQLAALHFVFSNKKWRN